MYSFRNFCVYKRQKFYSYKQILFIWYHNFDVRNVFTALEIFVFINTKNMTPIKKFCFFGTIDLLMKVIFFMFLNTKISKGKQTFMKSNSCYQIKQSRTIGQGPYCNNCSEFNRICNRRTDVPTDTVRCRVSCPRLTKIVYESHIFGVYKTRISKGV